MARCLGRELASRSSFLENEPVSTIYFGGGTPSLLETEELYRLLELIGTHYDVTGDPEITLEANPDDLTPDKLKGLRESGINRLSIGLQTFDDDLLKYLNRAHDRNQGLASVSKAREAGFDNLSVDLIYAIPDEKGDRLENDLQQLTALDVPHVSTYCLTIEPGTAFGNWYRKGKLTPVPDDQAANDYERIMNHLCGQGYAHYEISSFARPGFHSRHNSAYWQQKKYLGIGPGAHSYDLKSRRYNVSNNAKYMLGIENGEPVFGEELLSPTDQLNEFLLLSLRTSTGIDLEKLTSQFGFNLLESAQDYVNRLRSENLVLLADNHLRLTGKGKLLADQIAEDLFQVDPD